MAKLIYKIIVLILIPLMMGVFMMYFYVITNGERAPFVLKAFIYGAKLGLLTEVPTVVIILLFLYVKRKLRERIENLDFPSNTESN